MAASAGTSPSGPLASSTLAGGHVRTRLLTEQDGPGHDGAARGAGAGRNNVMTHCDAARTQIAISATHNSGGGCKVCETCHPLDTLDMSKEEERHSGGKVCEACHPLLVDAAKTNKEERRCGGKKLLTMLAIALLTLPAIALVLLTPLDSMRPEGMAHYLYERQRTGDEPLASGQAHRSREAGSPLLYLNSNTNDVAPTQRERVHSFLRVQQPDHNNCAEISDTRSRSQCCEPAEQAVHQYAVLWEGARPLGGRKGRDARSSNQTGQCPALICDPAEPAVHHEASNKTQLTDSVLNCDPAEPAVHQGPMHDAEATG